MIVRSLKIQVNKNVEKIIINYKALPMLVNHFWKVELIKVDPWKKPVLLNCRILNLAVNLFFKLFKKELFFLELNAFKDKFEKGILDEEASNKTILDLNIQLKGIKEALEKVVFFGFIFIIKWQLLELIRRVM